MKKLLPFITLFAGIAFTLTAYFLLQSNKDSLKPEFLNVHMFTTAKDIQMFELTSESEAPITNDQLLDKWTIINFGYTSCPDICPTNLADASIMIRILSEDMNINSEIQSWFVTVDPQRDTTEVLSNYTDAFHPQLLGLRGPQELINDLSLAFGFTYQIQKPIDEDEPSMYWVAHSDMMILINPEGKYAGYILPPYDSQNMAQALKNLIEG